MGSRGLHRKAAKGLNCWRGKFKNEIRRGPLDRRIQTGVGVVFDFAMLHLRRKIEHMLQLFTNRKSYMGFQLQQKSLTFNDLERQFTTLSSVLCAL